MGHLISSSFISGLHDAVVACVGIKTHFALGYLIDYHIGANSQCQGNGQTIQQHGYTVFNLR